MTPAPTETTEDRTRPAPRLALGCAQLGNLYEQRTDEQARAILQAAWDAGIRHFDTAPHYGLGLSERRLGQFLRGKPRDEFTVGTKVGRLLVADPGGAARQDAEGFAVPAAYRRVWDFSRRGVRTSLEASMERLGLDRIDTVLIHDPDDGDAHQALTCAAPELARLRARGVIDSFGAGTKDVALLARFARETEADTVMVAGRYTLLDQSALDDLLPTCLERGVDVLNAAIFNSGVLARSGSFAAARFEYASVPPAVLEKAVAIAARCRAHGTTLPAAAVAFAGAHPAVGALVVGADDAPQIRATSALPATPPPAALWRDLAALGLLRADAPVPA